MTNPPFERSQEVSPEQAEALERNLRYARGEPRPGRSKRMDEKIRAHDDYRMASVGIESTPDSMKLSSGVTVPGRRPVPELSQAARNLIRARKNLERQERVAKDEPAIPGSERPSEIRRRALEKFKGNLERNQQD